MLLLMLSLAAGWLDAVGYLGLGQVFVANMTGNTVLLGMYLGQGEWQAALRPGVALAGFVAGVAVGAVIVERGREEVTWPSLVTAALAVECVALTAFAGGWYLAGSPSGEAAHLLISLSALAMGVQSAAVRRLGVASVATTYVTGTLTNLTRRLVDRVRPDPARPASPKHDLELPADVWLVYGAGAAFGGVAVLQWQSVAAVSPLAVVAAVVAAAALRYRRR